MEELKAKPIAKPILTDFEGQKFKSTKDSKGELVSLDVITKRDTETNIAQIKEKIIILQAELKDQELLLKEF